MKSEEKETVIIWNERDSEAKIFTYNKKLKSRLRKYKEAKIDMISSDGSEQWSIPKKMIHIYSRKMSEKQKQILKENVNRLKKEEQHENL